MARVWSVEQIWLCTPCGIDVADDSPANPGNNAGMKAMLLSVEMLHRIPAP